MTIALESPDQPEVIALIAELDAYQDGLYPPESRHALDFFGYSIKKSMHRSRYRAHQRKILDVSPRLY